MRSATGSGVLGARVCIVAALAVATASAIVAAAPAPRGHDRPPPEPATAIPTPRVPRVEPPAASPMPRPDRSRPIRWRRSIAVGTPSAGRLVRGVRLPAGRRSFVTWDPVLRRSPNRHWRRWGTDRLVRILIGVARGYRSTHPDAPRIAIGDLSRPHGGDFGRRFGPIGHASHQNGLDADIYYPRADRLERPPRRASQIDRRRSQELVDRFLAAGAEVIFVGPNTGLTGPPERVQALANHDNHLHVRLPAGWRGARAVVADGGRQRPAGQAGR
jgi:murein endopeptidase